MVESDENVMGAMIFDRARQEIPDLQSADMGVIYTPRDGDQKLRYWQADEAGEPDNPRPEALPVGRAGMQLFNSNVSPDDILGEYRRYNAAPGTLAESVSGLVRQPYPSEAEFFRGRPDVSGMATEDNRIALNPNSPLSAQERNAVSVNEAARLAMRGYQQPAPALTPEQAQYLSTVNNGAAYPGGEAAQRETMIARLLSGDPSAGQTSQQQQEYAAKIKALIGNLTGAVKP
jgi:hypothetical protein